MHKVFEYLKKIIITSIVLFAAYYIFSGNKSFAPIIEERLAYYFPQKFPQLAGPVEKTYSWTYRGKQYSISQTLYVSAYEYYKSSTKSFRYVGSLPEDWQEKYYGIFFKKDESDKSISNLVVRLRELAIENKLSDDELVDLAVAFVQSIPYDEAKAREILSGTNSQTINYPYEVLFENKGVCSDKSILAAALLRELGYGTALFLYDEQKHMSVGVQCPEQYSNYDSGYCYIETTSTGNKIGIIPQLDQQQGKAVQVTEINDGNFQSQQQTQLTNLGEVEIVQKTQGREYGGIVGTIANIRQAEKLLKEMESLRKDIEKTKADIMQSENQLNEMRKSIEKTDPYEDVDAYNKKVKRYNEALEEYKEKVALFNKTVNLYNQKVKEYNVIISK